MTFTPMSRLVQLEGGKLLSKLPRKYPPVLYGPDNKPLHLPMRGVGDTVHVRTPEVIKRRGPGWGTA